MSRPIAKRLWYRFLYIICRLLAVIVFRLRCYGRQHLPTTGGVFVLSNHQSNMDPVLIGVACNRRLNYLARQSLFRFAPFRWLIQSLDAIPIDREGLGLSGLKETLRRLRDGEMVLIFPEGTRTSDGALGQIKPGFIAVARRAKAALAPVALDGAFQAWPRSRRFPRRTTLRIAFGPPIMPEEVAALDDESLAKEIRDRIQSCLQTARRSRERALRI